MPNPKRNKNQDPEVQKLLDSVLDFNEQSTSSEAEKRRKLAQRRNAVDAREEVTLNEKGNSTRSIGVQTDFSDKISLGSDEWTVFKGEIKEMVAQNTSEIKGFRRSVLYDVRSVKEKIDFHFALQNKTKSISELKSSINLEEPLKDLEAFFKFDEKIRTDKDHAAGVRELLAFTTRTKTIGEAVGGFVGNVMSYDVQILFSGCGKMNKGISKENFSATMTYMHLKEFLMKQFPDEKEGDVFSKISRWFANASDRKGGRKTR